MSNPPSQIKQIPASELRPGMFVHDLNCAWIEHPFLRKQFLLTDEGDVEKILSAGIRDVYIDTGRGLDAQHAPTAEEAQREQHAELLSLAQQPDAELLPRPRSHEEELSRAYNIRRQAHEVVSRVMQDARLGRAVELERVEPVVEQITASILRNSGALTGLMRIKSKDDYTFLHSVAVCALMVAFARHQGMDSALIHQAGIGGLLHDVGKMGVPDPILNKAGRLTETEFDIIRKHPENGHLILKATPGIGPLPLAITLQHHERVDGSGYPFRLAGPDILPLAKMAAIVDVYDAITSRRSYHAALQPTDALRKILQWSKYHFDPALVQSFIRCIGIYPVGTLVRLESNRLALVTEQNPANLLAPTVRVIFDARRREYVTPQPVDLARSLGAGGGDRIVGHEAPEVWGIDPARLD